MVALLVVLTILVFLTVDYFVQRRRDDAAAIRAADSKPALARFGRTGYRVPQGVFFDRGHTWAYLEESGDARLGVNDFAQSVLGEITELVTRAPGETVEAGDVILEWRHGQRSVPFRTPVAGIVTAVNPEVSGREELLSIEPQSASWICKIRPTDTAAFSHLMLGKTATDWLQREVGRLKVFLSTICPGHPTLGHTMQDGGLPAYGLIDFFDDAEWNKLRDKFFGTGTK